MFPRLYEVLLSKPMLISRLVSMLQALEKRRRSPKQHFRVIDLTRVEASTHEICSGADEGESLFDVVDKVDFAVGVGAVDEGEFDGGSGVAAVEEDGHTAVWGDGGDEDSVELGVVSLCAVCWREGQENGRTVSLVIWP